MCFFPSLIRKPFRLNKLNYPVRDEYQDFVFKNRWASWWLCCNLCSPRDFECINFLFTCFVTLIFVKISWQRAQCALCVSPHLPPWWGEKKLFILKFHITLSVCRPDTHSFVSPVSRGPHLLLALSPIAHKLCTTCFYFLHVCLLCLICYHSLQSLLK